MNIHQQNLLLNNSTNKIHKYRLKIYQMTRLLAPFLPPVQCKFEFNSIKEKCGKIHIKSSGVDINQSISFHFIVH